MDNDLKGQIAGSFSRYSKSYDQYAKLQKNSVGYLIKAITNCRNQLPDGPILEIGCGSGMLSETLAELFPERELFLIDIAPGMLTQCQKRLQMSGNDRPNIHFIQMDAEEITSISEYALVVSGLTLQWFNNLNNSIKKILETLLPGGKFLCSFLGSGSFPEWVEQCEKNKVSCTLNPLPNLNSVVEKFAANYDEIEHFVKELHLTYPSVIDFFISLKKTGTGVNTSGQSLRFADMKTLISNWDLSSSGEVKLTCMVNYLSVTK